MKVCVGLCVLLGGTTAFGEVSGSCVGPRDFAKILEGDVTATTPSWISPQPHRIFLCPNSIYHVLDEPLLLQGGQDVEIVCGTNGLSSNECIVTGGSIQLRTANWAAVTSTITLRGLTFTRASKYNVLVGGARTSITLDDCIFMDNENVASVYIDAPSGGQFRNDVVMSIYKTAFAGNFMGTQNGQSTGIIVNKGGSLRIQESVFLGNEDTSPHDRYSSYLVGNINGTLLLSDNCFVGNELDYATVVSQSPYLPLLSNNYGPEVPTTTGCEFIAVVGAEDNGVTCFDFDRPSCFVKHGYAFGYGPDSNTVASISVESKANIGSGLVGPAIITGALVASVLMVLM